MATINFSVRLPRVVVDRLKKRAKEDQRTIGVTVYRLLWNALNQEDKRNGKT